MSKERSKENADTVLLAFVRDRDVLVLTNAQDGTGRFPHGPLRADESVADAAERIAHDTLTVPVHAPVKQVGTYPMRLRDGVEHRVAVLVAPLVEEPASTAYGVLIRWQRLGSPAAGTATLPLLTDDAVTDLISEVKEHERAYAGPLPLTPERRRNLWLLGLFLAVVAAGGGVAFGISWNFVRLSVIDPSLAHDHGYIGELTDRAYPREPHGLAGQATHVALFLCWPASWFLAYFFARVSRLTRSVVYAEATLLLVFGPAAIGFWWHSHDWIEPEQGGPDGHPILYYGGVWVTAVACGVCLLALLAWWRTPAATHDRTEVTWSPR